MAGAKKAGHKRHPAVQGDPSVVRAIVGQRGVSSLVIEAELVGSYLEDNLRRGVSSTTNSIGATGPFQIIPSTQAAHGLTPKTANNPKAALRKWATPAYEAAVRKVPKSLLQSDPERYFETVAMTAEQGGDYYQLQGSGRVDAAFANAKAAVKGSGGGGGQAPIVAPSPAKTAKYAKAQQAAARRLYAAGLRGETLVYALADVGSLTKGAYTPASVGNFLSSFKENGGKLKETLGSAGYESGAYLKYIGSSLVALKAIGHPIEHFKYLPNTPGFEGTGGPTGPEKLADGASGAITDTFDLFKTVVDWWTDPDNLIRVGFIAIGVVFIIIGVAKLVGSGVAPTIKIG